MHDVEYHSAHVQMAWSQRFHKSEFSLDTGWQFKTNLILWTSYTAHQRENSTSWLDRSSWKHFTGQHS